MQDRSLCSNLVEPRIVRLHAKFRNAFKRRPTDQPGMERSSNAAPKEERRMESKRMGGFVVGASAERNALRGDERSERAGPRQRHRPDRDSPDDNCLPA